MPVKKYKPTSAGRRFQTTLDFQEITASRPEKGLTVGMRSTGGRNNQGRTTSRFMGGGHKRLYRIIDFRRDKLNIPAKVATIEYDPNRTARIALLHYADGEKRYILAPNGLQVGAQVVSGPAADRQRLDTRNSGGRFAHTRNARAICFLRSTLPVRSRSGFQRSPIF